VVKKGKNSWDGGLDLHKVKTRRGGKLEKRDIKGKKFEEGH